MIWLTEQLPQTIYTISVKFYLFETSLKPYRPLGYERVYLPLYKVADTPFHIQGAVHTDLAARGLISVNVNRNVLAAKGVKLFSRVKFTDRKSYNKSMFFTTIIWMGGTYEPSSPRVNQC